MRRLWYGGLALASAAGLAALVVRLVEGLRVTNLTSSISWGLWVALYIYFVGLSAGSFLLSSLVYVFGMHRFEKVGRMALLSALFALGGALTFIWIDLGKPWRFWHALVYPHFGSVMAVEMILYLAYIALILAELHFLMRADLAAAAASAPAPWRWVMRALALRYRPPSDPARADTDRRVERTWVRLLGIVGVPVAIGVHGGTGAIFAVVGARPYWFGGLFPVVFLVSALASGAALTTFLHVFFGDRRDPGHASLARALAELTALFVAIDLLLVASELLSGLYGGSTEHVQAWRAVMFGRYAAVFWAGQVGLAGVVTLALVAAGVRRGSTTLLGLAGAAAVVGVIAIRLNIVIPAYTQPELAGLDTAYQGARLAYRYFPSGAEWLVSVGMVAFGVLLFSLALEHLPVRAQAPSEV
jgi:molybdopterin-containing oxidoreductase family membrane subunit